MKSLSESFRNGQEHLYFYVIFKTNVQQRNRIELSS